MNRRSFLAAAAASGAVGIAGCVGGSDEEFPYDGADIELWIPFGTGGGADTVVRGAEPYVNEYFTEIHDVDVNTAPVNVAGGGATTMPSELWVTDPDGLTLGVQNLPHMVIGELTEDLPYESLEFEYVGILEENLSTIVVDPELGVDSWDELVDYAESEGALRGATGGAGATSHIVVEVLAQEAGVDTQYVHFETVAEAAPAIERGEAHVSCLNAGTAVPWVEDGVLDYLLMVNDKQSPVSAVPDMPLASEEEVPGWETAMGIGTGFKALSLPPDTPSDIVEAWEEVAVPALGDEEFRDFAEENSRPVVNYGSDEAREMMETTYNAFGEIEDLLSELVG